MRTGREHTRAPTGSVRAVPGPCSTISAQNSWPITTSRPRSMGLPPARRAVSTNFSACLSACRSEPQIPHASVRTSTSPGPGCGTGTSATISLRSRMTAARMAGGSVEHQHRAGDLAGLHRAEGLVDVLELAAAADHLVELQPALAIELDVARHVDLEAVAAHAAALDLLLAQEHRPVQLDLLAHRDHADDGGGAAGLEAVEALLGGDLEADGLERIVDATFRQRADGLGRVVALGVDRMRGPELLGLGELALDGVDRDDHVL